MSEIVKNQHYVPRTYLDKFANKEGMIWVFDKKDNKIYQTNIKNVACEKYFYDIPEKYLADCSELQIVEKHLAKIESRFGPCRDAILSQVEHNDRFDPALKDEFAEFVLLQLLRTKLHREQFNAMGKLLEMIPNLSEQLVKSLQMPNDMLSFGHARMMFDPEILSTMKRAIISHIWIIGKNKSPVSFYTSDAPVVRFPHISNPLFGTNGVASKGIEIDFPLSPKHILIIAERSYHHTLTNLENKSLDVINEDNIKFLNGLQTSESYRHVYSDKNDFKIAFDIIKDRPYIANVDRLRIEMVNPKPSDKPKDC